MIAATLLQGLTSPALVAALGALAVGFWMAFRPEDETLPKLFLVIMSIPVVGILSGLSLEWANKMFPFKFDYVLYAVDHALGFSPALFGGAVFTSRAGKAVVGFLYSSMGIAMAFCYGRTLRSANGRPNRLLLAYLINLVVGCALYWLVPACGPVYAFGSRFRSNPAVPAMITTRLNADPNAIPSLHLSTALIMLFFSRDDPKTRVAAGLYAVATAIVTLATGEHYLIDLIVAAPFALFAISSAERQWRRGMLALASVFAWLLVIRFVAPVLVHHRWLLLASAAVSVVIPVAFISAHRASTTATPGDEGMRRAGPEHGFEVVNAEQPGELL